MNKSQHLFNNLKLGKVCNRPRPESYNNSICPACQENQLFHEVREYIRTNDVTEYQVAEHFGISLKQVKSWIREGRIEYKEKSASNTIAGLHCQRCGAPVSFGALCPKCLKVLNGGKGYNVNNNSTRENNKMRYLEQE